MTLEDRIKQAEGYRATAYKDSVGVWTIGYGTNLQTLEIDEQLAARWLRDKIEGAWKDAATFPWFNGLDGRRQEAVVELLYNLGLARFRGFQGLIGALAGHEFAKAKAELIDSKWFKQVGPERGNRLADALGE